jgi:hypothetical protein
VSEIHITLLFLNETCSKEIKWQGKIPCICFPLHCVVNVIFGREWSCPWSYLISIGSFFNLVFYPGGCSLCSPCFQWKTSALPSFWVMFLLEQNSRMQTPPSSF